jgi:hypothetical protein
LTTTSPSDATGTSADTSGNSGESGTGTTTTADDTNEASTDGSDTTDAADSGPLLDVLPEDTTATAESGGGVPIDCDNIDMVEDTSVGCEFWSTNWTVSSGFGMAIGVGNPTDDLATVTIEQNVGGTVQVIATEMLAAGESSLIQIDGPGGVLSGNYQVAVGANPLSALHVVSDVPITAMQVAPAGGADTHISEASLLLPQNSLREAYFAAGYNSFSGAQGRVAVIGTEDDTTITTTDGMATINRWDVQVYSGADITGFFVGADKKVAVFSGNAGTFIPAGMYASDHLQEQMVPAASWGTSYIGGRHPVRYTASNLAAEPVYWRAIAGEDDTTISLTPAVAGASVNIPNAGGFIEFTSTESFLAESDKPFLLLQYMSGCENVVPMPLVSTNPCNEPGTGDPFMIQTPPIEQWLDALPFLTDSSYPRDFVVITREVGTTVTLDCLGEVDASHFVAIPGTDYEVGTVELDILDMQGGEGNCQDGAQFLTASAPVGVIVGGVDWATSYGYPGGLAFQDLWTPPFDPPG